jgi:chromosome segregation ATPase
VEGEPLDLDAIESGWNTHNAQEPHERTIATLVAALRSAREERDALLALRDSWANDYASLSTFMRERDEARERAADYERACKAREEAIDGLTSEAMDLIKERDEARAALAEEQDSHKESLDIFRRRVDRLEAELAVVRCQRHRVLVYCLALKDAGHPDIAATLCKLLEDAP